MSFKSSHRGDGAVPEPFQGNTRMEYPVASKPAERTSNADQEGSGRSHTADVQTENGAEVETTGDGSSSSRNAGVTNDADQEAGRQLEPHWDAGDDANERKKSSSGGYVQNRYFILESRAPSSTAARTLRHFAILGLLVVSSMWGLLAREGLVALNTYAGMSIEPTVWAQAVGCLVMGWTISNRQALERWYPPAYIMISTGFCGSLTTFSSWIVHAFQAYGNQNHYNRHGLHNVMDALTQTFVTLGMSLAALYAGQALSHVLPAHVVLHFLERATVHRSILKRQKNNHNDDGNKKDRRTVVDEDFDVPYTAVPDTICILLGIIFWAGAAVLCGTFAPFRHVTYAVVLSPPGAMLRWYLSPLNSHKRSKRAPFWPLGTLAANLIATAVLCGVFVGQHVGRAPGADGGGARTVDGCHALYGVQEGFCGCLSTISTFAVELDTLKPRRRAVGYAVGSYVLGMMLCVLIIGAPWWSIGMDGSCVGITL